MPTSEISFRAAETKVQTRSNLQKIVEEAKGQGKTVVFTNGCFDILHIGHVRYLQDARALGDMLVVGVNSDSSVSKLKGPERPVVPEDERMEILAALECVSYVTLFQEDTPVELITAIRPDIHTKGGDYNPDDLPEADAVRAVGGRIELIPLSKTETRGRSTTRLIEKLRS